MPQTVVLRAKDLLKELEQLNGYKSDSPEEIGTNYQMSLVQWESPEVEALKKELEQLDVNAIAPIDALLLIQRWKSLLK